LTGNVLAAIEVNHEAKVPASGTAKRLGLGVTQVYSGRHRLTLRRRRGQAA
jgi:hypothetical protein